MDYTITLGKTLWTPERDYGNTTTKPVISETLEKVMVSTSYVQSWLVSVSMRLGLVILQKLNLDKSRSPHIT